jgi:hypothetical protein
LASSSSRQQGLVVGRRELQATQPTWIQLGADIDGEAAWDNSGNSVSLSSDGTVLAVGADYNDGNGSDSGHVRVFTYANNVWTQLGADIDGEAVGDNFGKSVSLSSDGTVLAVGASSRYYYSGNKNGHVRVYEYANSQWTQRGAEINGEAAENFFGNQVDLSSDGTVLAVGAWGNDGNGSNSGHARVYQFANNAWAQMGADIDGEAAGDYSGESVSLSSDGTVLAVGASSNDGINGEDSGHVRVYKHVNSQWTQLGADIDGEAACDGSGTSVSLSSDGTVLAVGAEYNFGSGKWSGHVRVYKFSNNSWTQLGSDIDGEAAEDTSGSSVSLSSDGTVLAVGAYRNDGTSQYGNRGHARVYKYTNGKWTQIGADIDGEAAFNQSGWSVSLSSDGTVLAVGAPNAYSNNDILVGDRGHVRVYRLTSVSTAPSTPKPTNKPTNKPTTKKPIQPTRKPSNKPTNKPTTNKPSTRKPTNKPTKKPN